MRSRSRWNSVRNGSGSMGRSRPRDASANAASRREPLVLGGLGRLARQDRPRPPPRLSAASTCHGRRLGERRRRRGRQAAPSQRARQPHSSREYAPTAEPTSAASAAIATADAGPAVHGRRRPRADDARDAATAPPTATPATADAAAASAPGSAANAVTGTDSCASPRVPLAPGAALRRDAAP